MELIEGISIRQLLELPEAELDRLLLTDEPLVFVIGSAHVLGRARLEPPRRVVELGHIDGGGEGGLRAAWCFARAYARRRGVDGVEWLIHAVTCARRNLKLSRVLERRGFTVQEVTPCAAFIDDIGAAEVSASGDAARAEGPETPRPRRLAPRGLLKFEPS